MSRGICPLAEWRPLPENATQPASGNRLVIVHSIVGSAEGAYGYFKNSTSLESHFIVKKDGRAIQCIDCDRSADANYKANKIAISIETEDNGDPNNDPWTAAQLEAMRAIIDWAISVYGIPRRTADGPFGAGIGYHTMWGAPSDWTPVAKSCPGNVRIDQFRAALMPAVLAGIPASVTPDNQQEDTDKMVRTYAKDNAVWVTDGIVTRHVTGPEDLETLEKMGVPALDAGAITRGFHEGTVNVGSLEALKNTDMGPLLAAFAQTHPEAVD